MGKPKRTDWSGVVPFNVILSILICFMGDQDAKTEAEHVRLDLTMDEVVDLRSNMVRIAYNNDFVSASAI